MARVSIEDCLNVMDNRFALVRVASKRTRQLMDGEEALLKTRNKLGVTALREIAEGLVVTQMQTPKSTAHQRQDALAAQESVAQEMAQEMSSTPALEADASTAVTEEAESVPQEAAVTSEAPAESQEAADTAAPPPVIPKL